VQREREARWSYLQGAIANRIFSQKSLLLNSNGSAPPPFPWVDAVHTGPDQHGANVISLSNFAAMPLLPPHCSRVACCSEERASATTPVIGLSACAE